MSALRAWPREVTEDAGKVLAEAVGRAAHRQPKFTGKADVANLRGCWPSLSGSEDMWKIHIVVQAATDYVRLCVQRAERRPPMSKGM